MSLILVHFFSFDSPRDYSDLDKLVWNEIHTLGLTPAPRAGMTLCTLGDKLYMFGGSGSSSLCFNDIHIFDISNSMPQTEPKIDFPLATSTWTVAALNDDKIIKSRAGHSMSASGGYLYVIGGSFGQKYFRDYFILDTGKKTHWQLSHRQLFRSCPRDQNKRS